MWDLQTARMTRKFTGQRQGSHIIRSCFGGAVSWQTSCRDKRQMRSRVNQASGIAFHLKVREELDGQVDDG